MASKILASKIVASEIVASEPKYEQNITENKADTTSSLLSCWKTGLTLSGWTTLLSVEWDKPYMQQLVTTVNRLYLTTTVYPPKALLFEALRLCAVSQVRVVILGQDPYHTPNSAHGVAFSIRSGYRLQPSVSNIFKEIEDDVGITAAGRTGDLTSWCRQGVLLLNTVLTVEAGKAASHAKHVGWEPFTQAILTHLSQQQKHIVFMLWGKPAQKLATCIQGDDHCILYASHPSPLSAHRGFFGCKHFSKANAFLRQHGLSIIDWS